jgi:aldose 1-epimerase
VTRELSPPSGRQFELRHGAQRAIVVEVGGGLRQYEVDGRPVLDGYDLDRMADGGRGQPLLPWPNRLGDGTYEFDGQQLQLAIDEIGRHNAIHGLTRWLNWAPVEQATDRVRLSQRVYPRPGYPFTLDLEIEYALDDAGLTVRTTAHNGGSRALPFGAGQHPYFTLGSPLVDTNELQLPARALVELDDARRLPTGQLLPVAGSAFDFRTSRQIGSLQIDACFTDLIREGDGRARVVLSDPQSRSSVTIWMDERYRYVQAFSGETLAPERRRRGLAVEPMTCPPHALQTGTDLIVLQPDETCTLAWGAARI